MSSVPEHVRSIAFGTRVSQLGAAVAPSAQPIGSWRFPATPAASIEDDAWDHRQGLGDQPSPVSDVRLGLQGVAMTIANAVYRRDIYLMAKSKGESRSKYAGRSAATGGYVLRPATEKLGYRSATTGRFLTAKSAKGSPSTTLRETGGKKPKREK